MKSELLSQDILEREVIFMKKNKQMINKDVIGGQYQVSILRDEFVPLILGALGKINTEKVWAKTGKTSTVYRGRSLHVVDCMKACLSHIYDDSMPYVGLNASFFKMKDDDLDNDYYIATDDVLLNNTTKSFNVLSRIHMSPLGDYDYKKASSVIDELAVKHNISIDKGFYANDFEGDVNDTFNFINELIAYGNDNYYNYVISLTMTVYGPEAIKS